MDHPSHMDITAKGVFAALYAGTIIPLDMYDTCFISITSLSTYLHTQNPRHTAGAMCLSCEQSVALIYDIRSEKLFSHTTKQTRNHQSYKAPHPAWSRALIGFVRLFQFAVNEVLLAGLGQLTTDKVQSNRHPAILGICPLIAVLTANISAVYDRVTIGQGENNAC